MISELIPVEEIQDASVIHALAENAASIHEQEAVTALINQAANTGEFCAYWNNVLSEDLKETLESKGYTVTQNSHSAYDTVGYIIAW